MNRILALVDGSIFSKSVCDHAAWMSRRAGLTVELVHVLDRNRASSAPANLSGSLALGARTALLDELSAHDEQAARLARKLGRAILEDARAILEAGGVESIETTLRVDDIVDAISHGESNAGLVLVGKLGETAHVAEPHLGSNLERIIRASTKPVMVASRDFRNIDRLLIAFDGGASCFKAVEHVAESPVFKGLDCKLLSVGSNNSAIRRQLDQAAALLREAGIKVESDVVEGTPETAITETVEAEHVDLLVMGAYSHSRLRNLIVGSKTSEMLRLTRIPVIVFR